MNILAAVTTFHAHSTKLIDFDSDSEYGNFVTSLQFCLNIRQGEDWKQY